MKKLLFAAASIILMIGCNSNGEKNRETSDTLQLTDTVTQAEVQKDTLEQSKPEGTQLDSVDKQEVKKEAKEESKEKVKEDTGQYDELLSQYETAVKSYQKFVKNFNGNYSKQPSYTTKCNNLYKKIEKVKNKLSPEQQKKFKSLKSKYDNAYYSIQG